LIVFYAKIDWPREQGQYGEGGEATNHGAKEKEQLFRGLLKF